MTQRLHSRGKGRSLPAGYQFGDARPYARQEREFYAKRALYAAAKAAEPTIGAPVVVKLAPWRPLHLNAAERLTTSHATDYSKRSPYTTDRDLGDER